MASKKAVKIKVRRREPEQARILNALPGMQHPPLPEQVQQPSENIGPDEKTPVIDMGPALKLLRVALRQ